MLAIANPDAPYWPALAAMIRDSFAYMTPLLGHPPRACALSADDLRSAAANGTAFVILDNDSPGESPVACLFTRPSRDVAGALYLGWLAIAESHRKRGLTKRLFDAAQDHAIARAHTALTLDTAAPLTGLHALFEHLGFTPLATHDDVARFIKPLPRRLAADDPALPRVLALLRRAFKPMDGVIDPPSSLSRMTLETLSRAAAQSELWVIAPDGNPAACVTLTPRPDTLYIGKLATDPARQGTGLARQLVTLAEARARALGRTTLTLQTRVELTANHATFRALGFVQTGATAHPGYDRATSLTFTKPLG